MMSSLGSFLNSQGSKVSWFRQRRLWLDCVDVQANLSLRLGYMSEGTFLTLRLKCPVKFLSKVAFILDTWSGSVWFGSSWFGSKCVHTSNQVDAFTLWTKLIQINLICIKMIWIKFVFTLLLRSHCNNANLIRIRLIQITLIWIKLVHSANADWCGSSWSASN